MQTIAWIIWIAGLVSAVVLIAGGATIVIGRSQWLAQRRADRAVQAMRTFDILTEVAAKRRDGDTGIQK